MAGETVITVVGNLVDDPELRFTPSGAAVAKFRVASTPRIFDKQTNEWKDGEGLFLTCSVWRQAAENVAESRQRGMRVIVQGRLKQRSYEDREGVKRTVYELDVEEVGAGHDERLGLGQEVVERPVAALVVERVGRAVEDAHHDRPRRDVEAVGTELENRGQDRSRHVVAGRRSVEGGHGPNLHRADLSSAPR